MAIQIVDYNPEWARAFLRLRDQLWPLVADLAISGHLSSPAPIRSGLNIDGDGPVGGIEHVGSTSVPGLAAKPVLDVDIVVPTLSTLPVLIARLSALGYVHRGNLGIEGREAFKAPAERRVHLYVCENGGEALRNHLTLRDHLRRTPEDVAAYSALKKRLAREYPDDMDRYIAGKTTFILSILARYRFDAAALDRIRSINS